MISKLNRIKGLGLVFADFTWSAAVPAFRGFNLVYGWNGCGKTTLTRLFDELGATASTGIEYEVEDATGAKFTADTRFSLPIRVFNQDYVQKNVRILESSANSISVLLGAENKELVTQIEEDERDLNGNPTDATKIGKVQELHGFTEKRKRKERGNETAFTDIAKTIGAAIVGSGAASRTYRSPDAKKDFATISEPALLSDESREGHILALKQEMLPELAPLTAPPVEIEGRREESIDVAQQALIDATKLCAATVESETIQRLNENADISGWVETGLHIHTKNRSRTCEFCGNTVPVERLAQIARHFSEADRKLKAEIDSVLAKLRDAHRAITAMAVPDAARLYRELQKPYNEASNAIEGAKAKLIEQITSLGKTLQDKKLRTSDAVALNLALEIPSFSETLAAANAVVETHNSKSRDFAAVQQKSVRAIKVHYLSTIFEDVTRRNEEIVELDIDLERRAAEVSEIRNRISAARAAISSSHAACEQINDGLKTFLGREELRFEPETKGVEGESGQLTETVVGYRIMRGAEPAVYLSEGEKTALAFVYFVVHLNDGQFPKKDGIVVIDDPISSLDSNSLYQAFSFLKNAVADCRQVFVLTHNFDFLKLLLNWRKNTGGAGYYMIKNHFDGDDRRASIVEMDRELKSYESEYHYLFKRLKEMRVEQDGSIMRAYPVPNIARKVWDTFLMFRVPSGTSQYQKMEQLKKDGFDPQKLDAIYKFTNEQSHMTGGGFDPALVPETKKVLDELFEMMQAIAADHFGILDRATPI